MSDQSTAERKAAARGLGPGTSIDNLTFLLGVGAIVAALVGGSCSTNARIGDLHTEIQDVRSDIQGIRDETRTEFQGVRDEIQGIRDETRAEFQGIRDETRAEFQGVRDALRTEIQGVRAELRAEIRDVRTRVERLEDSNAVSFATVHRQLGAVAVCLLDLRNIVVGDSGAASRVPTACDDAIQVILTPSAPAGR